jgi:predicted TIM-barrel fold metal-dependent hydrolase
MYEEIAELPVIDAHEHLPSEGEYLSRRYCGPNLFAGGYIQHDLRSAGLSEDFVGTLRDPGYRPVEEWWPRIRPFWGHVRHTSFSRALRITVHDLFGIDRIDDDTIHTLAEAVQNDNTPGIYRRNLQERCNIQYSLCVSHEPAFPKDPGLKGVAPLPVTRNIGRGNIGRLSEKSGTRIVELEDAAHAAQSLLRRSVAAGATGFKNAAFRYGPPDETAAEKELAEALSESAEERSHPALGDYLFDRCCDVAAEADLPVAIHTGYWGDFRELDPKHMLGFALRRPDVLFDMFHLGVPMYRDALQIAKNLPNVTLNLTWCPIISQLQTKRSLDEIIDLVPLNKIIAFGGDYKAAVQKVYGHLVMAREVVAAALSDRVECGDFDRAFAMEVAKMWFFDNPSRIYRLDRPGSHNLDRQSDAGGQQGARRSGAVSRGRGGGNSAGGDK